MQDSLPRFKSRAIPLTLPYGAIFIIAMAMLLGGCSSSPAPPISVSLSPASPQTIDQGMSVAITAAVTNEAPPGGVRWSLKGPGSLGSFSGLSATYYSPTTSLASEQTATVIATSAVDPTKSASLAIAVNPYPAMPFQSLANGTVGTPYNQTITLTGGTAPFQWSVYDGPIATGWRVAGAVPNGLTLGAANGTISGTPTAAGTWYFEATATDTDHAFTFAALSIQINPAGSVAANPVPFLNQPLVPTAVAPGSSGLTLKVNGAGFVSGATIDWNGAPLTTTFVDSEHLSALVPAANVTNAQTASVTVMNPAPGGGSSNVVYFQVGAPETTVDFANAPNSPLQVPTAVQLAAADFNQDGKPDLAISAKVWMYVELGNGDGTFRPAPGSPIPIPSPPYDDSGSPYTAGIAVGDFDKSGHEGLAVNLMQNSAAAILLGNGDGTFGYSSSLADTEGYGVGTLVAADFNGDGNLDLFAVNPLGPLPVVLLGYGDGVFNNMAQNELSQEASPLDEQWGYSAAAGDFNGDGKLDVVLPDTETGNSFGVSVLLGNGGGTFTQANGSPISLGKALLAIDAADFNGDGKLDIAVMDTYANAAYILLGNGDGTFQSPITVPVGNSPEAVAVGDFNNDGKLDLAVADYGDNTVTLLLGNGDGTFTEASGSPYAVGKGPGAIVAADFNGDGKLDLAVANDDETVSILLQQ